MTEKAGQHTPEAVPDDETLAESFWSVARRLRHLTLETVTPLGVTPAQARAVNILHRHGPMRLSDLAGHLRIAARSATGVVDALQERELVLRSPDPEDRRATLVTLTRRGERVADDLRSARVAEADAFFSTLSPDDRESLSRVLRALRQ